MVIIAGMLENDRHMPAIARRLPPVASSVQTLRRAMIPDTMPAKELMPHVIHPNNGKPRIRLAVE